LTAIYAYYSYKLLQFSQSSAATMRPSQRRLRQRGPKPGCLEANKYSYT